MANQFLKVEYDRRRGVYIDGTHSGFTNRKLRVEAGPHQVDLGEPENYAPPAWDIDIHGTSIGRPMVLEFTRKDDGDGGGDEGDDDDDQGGADDGA